MTWQRLSERMKGAHAEPLGPVEGLPDYLMGPVLLWVEQVLSVSDGYSTIRGQRDDALRLLQLHFRLSPPLDWTGHDRALPDLLSRMRKDEELALDVVDWGLHVLDAVQPYNKWDLVGALDPYLVAGGSVWEVARTADGEAFQLARRAVGPVREAIAALTPSDRAHQHMLTAWGKLVGRDPDPSAAYREAIRAVEAAGKPVISPNNSLTTLGTMIRDVRAKPSKWVTTLGEIDVVLRMMEIVWKGQHDRHGTDNDKAPLHATQEEADAAVHTCLTLVRLFVGGHVRTAV